MLRPSIRFEIIDRISAPGAPARANEDAWCATDRLAAVIDGATGLGENLLPGASDAAWLASQAAERLVRRADRGDARAVLAATAFDLETAFLNERRRPPVDTYETPFASLILLAPDRGERLEALWFGDCTALIARANAPVEVVGDAFAKRGAEAAMAARLAGPTGAGPAAGRNRPEFLEALRTARNRYNRDHDGPWVLAPDARCAFKARSAVVEAPAGSCALLASDGFLALATDYGRYDPESLVAAAQSEGLETLLAELRAIEQEDPDGLAYPRFKTSDDATALLLRVC